jgi:hypothetical protein
MQARDEEFLMGIEDLSFESLNDEKLNEIEEINFDEVA